MNLMMKFKNVKFCVQTWSKKQLDSNHIIASLKNLDCSAKLKENYKIVSSRISKYSGVP